MVKFIGVPLVCILLRGCDPAQMVDSNVETQIHEYFPLAEVSHPVQGQVLITTHVGNITEKFAAQVMSKLLIDHLADLKLGLTFAGYNLLRVSFDDGECGWRPQWQYFQCVSRPFGQTPRHTYTLAGVFWQ